MPLWTNSAVRISTTHDRPNYDRPWEGSTSTSTGTGVIIERGLVLCTADLVQHAAVVHVQPWNRADSVTAEIKAVAHDCDLALLEVPDFGIAPAELASGLPALWDEAAVANYSSGTMALVKGVVSKVVVQRYTHSQRHLLAVVIDAAIEPGAGPTYQDGKLVGLAIQRANDEDRSVDLVPIPLIRAFLDGVRDGKPPYVPALGLSTQNLENPRLRQYIGAGPGDHGVVVLHVDHGGSADGALERGDLMMSIEGIPIANNGLVTHTGDHPVRYDAVVGTHHVGDRIRVEIKRAGKRMTADLTLTRWLPLVPRSGYDTPQFLVYGGLLFQRLTRDYLTTWDSWWNTAPKEFLNAYYLGHRTPAQHELVVLTQIFDDALNTGYSHLYNEVVSAVNGVVPRDMRTLYAKLLEARGTVRIETTSGGLIVLDAEEVRAETPRILSEYGIPFAASIDEVEEE